MLTMLIMADINSIWVYLKPNDESSKPNYIFFSPGNARFGSNVKEMLGKMPGRWWLLCWKFVAPIIIVVSLNKIVCMLTPSDAIWQHSFGSTLAQVMACCLTAPSHYLNQCWVVIKDVLLHSHGSNFTRSAHELNQPRTISQEMLKISLTYQWLDVKEM